MKQHPFKVPHIAWVYIGVVIIVVLSLCNFYIFKKFDPAEATTKERFEATIFVLSLYGTLYNYIGMFYLRVSRKILNELYPVLLQNPSWIYMRGLRVELNINELKKYCPHINKYRWVKQSDYRELMTHVRRRMYYD